MNASKARGGGCQSTIIKDSSPRTERVIEFVFLKSCGMGWFVGYACPNKRQKRTNLHSCSSSAPVLCLQRSFDSGLTGPTLAAGSGALRPSFDSLERLRHALNRTTCTYTSVRSDAARSAVSLPKGCDAMRCDTLSHLNRRNALYARGLLYTSSCRSC